MKFLAALLVSLVMPCAFAQNSHPDPLAHHLVFRNGDLHIHAVFEAQPEVMKEAFLRLETKDPKTHTNVDIEDSIKVTPWMPSMGHGSAPTVIQKVVDANGQPVKGTYRVSRVFFTMGGTWEVQVQLTAPNGQVETQSFELDFASNGGHHH